MPSHRLGSLVSGSEKLARGTHEGRGASCNMLGPKASIWVSESQVCAGCWTLQWTGFTDLTFDSHPSDDSVSPGQGGGRDESARKATLAAEMASRRRSECREGE